MNERGTQSDITPGENYNCVSGPKFNRLGASCVSRGPEAHEKFLAVWARQ